MSNRWKPARPSRLATPKSFGTIDEITTAVAKFFPTERVGARPLVERFLPQRAELLGKEGFDRVTQFCTAIEAELGGAVRGCNGLQLFEGLRRVSGRLWTRAGSGQEVAVRSVAELSVHRYADWTSARSPAATPHSWTSGELRLLAKIIVLAELYSNVLATRRRLAKGQIVRVGSTAPLVFQEITDQRLEHMINLVDARSRSEANPYATVGVLSGTRMTRDDDPQIIAARLVEPERRDQFGLNGPRWHDPLVDCFYLETVESELELLDQINEGLDGFTLRDLHFALDLASTAVQVAWVDMPTTLALSGYALALPLAWDLLDKQVDQVRSNPASPFREVTAMSVRRALDFLDAGKANTDLDITLAQRPLRRIGDVMLYDALHVYIAGPILWDVPVPERAQDLRSRAAEPAVHRLISNLGRQPWPSGHNLKSGKQLITDVDASVVIGTTLVAVDCYASPWSSDLDRGTHNVTSSRLSNLRKKLATWDQRWARVVKDFPHLLPAGVAAVLPVVVSTRAEWIDNDDDPREWLTAQVPRFCTAHELHNTLQTSDVLASHPSLIVVQRGGPSGTKGAGES